MHKLQKQYSKKQSDTDSKWPTLIATNKCGPGVTSDKLTTKFDSMGILVQNSRRLSEVTFS